MKAKYKCLILDHDDTAVKSTPEVHFPSFLKGLETLRPDFKITLEEFITYCFNPGFMELCRDILKFTDEEQKVQYGVWKKYTDEVIPDFYEGFVEILDDFKKLGGIITVVSHSESNQIKRHYYEKSHIVPDSIFGWELGDGKRKPNPYPVEQIIKQYGLKRSEIIVVDDLKPGMEMARQSNVAFGCAGWAHRITEIEQYMKQNSDVYFSSVEDLRNHIFEE